MVMEINSMTEKKSWKPPSFIQILIVTLIGFYSSRIVFTTATFVYLTGLVFFVGVPVYLIFNQDKEAMRNTERLVKGLEEPLGILE
jgi:hypothetical protein